MANRPAPGLWISEIERVELQRLTRSSSVSAGLAQRARIVLLAGEGVANTAIAERVGVSRPTVIAWRGRYQGKGLAGLEDAPRSGRPRRVDPGQGHRGDAAPATEAVWGHALVDAAAGQAPGDRGRHGR